MNHKDGEALKFGTDVNETDANKKTPNISKSVRKSPIYSKTNTQLT